MLTSSVVGILYHVAWGRDGTSLVAVDMERRRAQMVRQGRFDAEALTKLQLVTCIVHVPYLQQMVSPRSRRHDMLPPIVFSVRFGD